MARQRLTVDQAAPTLGISTDAVRKRARRGTLESEKAADGTVYIWVDGSTPDGVPGGGPLLDGGGPGGVPPTQAHSDSQDMLIQFLRSELAAWQEEARRKDHIIAALTERIPELEAPSEPRESPVRVSEEEKREAPPEQQESSQRRSWWRQFFGLQ